MTLTVAYDLCRWCGRLAPFECDDCGQAVCNHCAIHIHKSCQFYKIVCPTCEPEDAPEEIVERPLVLMESSKEEETRPTPFSSDRMDI